ncbi:MAG TPA: condensation domain-containing protein [Thermoanaerobaculia bacterium]|nr:condensation domain-containing protein [Thermoanaerobaculia bacterium]
MTANLTPEMQLLLRRRLQQKKGDGAIPRRAGARDRFPLSLAQQRLWTQYRQQPESTAYNVVKGYRFGGDGQPPVDLPLLESCFNQVVQRHESLRTVFREEGGQAMQVVLPSLHVTMHYVDARGSGIDMAQQWADREADTPFDLERGPLLRLRAVQIDERSFAVLVSLHHIIFDGWSSGVFLDDMTAFYRGAVTGAAPSLAPLPIQYGDYAAWQREQVLGEAGEAEMRFWRLQLGDAAPLTFASDRPRPLVPSGRGGSVQFAFSKELSEALVAFSRRENVTTFMLVLAAYYVLLARISGSEQLLVGTLMAGRQRKETERLIGYLVNTLVLRGDVSGQPAFRELLQRVRESALAAFAHQEFPYERLADELRPDGTPLVQAMLIVHNWKKHSHVEDGFHMSTVAATRQTSRFDLSLGLEELDTWCGSLEYATDLFDESTARGLVAQFEQILTTVILSREDGEGSPSDGAHPVLRQGILRPSTRAQDDSNPEVLLAAHS